jgi:hypothetical protein
MLFWDDPQVIYLSKLDLNTPNEEFFKAHKKTCTYVVKCSIEL